MCRSDLILSPEESERLKSPANAAVSSRDDDALLALRERIVATDLAHTHALSARCFPKLPAEDPQTPCSRDFLPVLLRPRFSHADEKFGFCLRASLCITAAVEPTHPLDRFRSRAPRAHPDEREQFREIIRRFSTFQSDLKQASKGTARPCYTKIYHSLQDVLNRGEILPTITINPRSGVITGLLPSCMSIAGVARFRKVCCMPYRLLRMLQTPRSRQSREVITHFGNRMPFARLRIYRAR